ARGAKNWLTPASTSCRIAFCLISKAGRSKTSSRIDRIGGLSMAILSTDRLARPAIGPADGVAARPWVTGSRDLAVAYRVIRAEIDGLESLTGALDGTFETAVEACAAATGRIIVTGV